MTAVAVDIAAAAVFAQTKAIFEGTREVTPDDEESVSLHPRQTNILSCAPQATEGRHHSLFGYGQVTKLNADGITFVLAEGRWRSVAL